MKKILILIFLVTTTSTFANDLYVLKDEMGVTYFSANPPKNPNHTIEKVEHYDSSRLGSWGSSCKRDRFDNVRECTLYRLGGQIVVGLSNGRYSVLIGANHFPNSKSALKIDGNATLYGLDGILNNPNKAIEQLKIGRVAYTRFQEWPKQSNKDNEESLEGFMDAFNQMLIEYKKL